MNTERTPPFVIVGRGNGKTVAERKAEYDQSALKQLMDANEHEICERCYCCDAVWESEACGVCGGFSMDDEYDGIDDDWPMPPCFHCNGEGEVSYKVCAGRCDENGKHADVV